VTAWLLPGAAGAMWLGLVLAPTLGDRAPTLGWLLAAAVLFATSVWSSPSGRPDALAAIDPAPPAVSAIEPARAGYRRTPRWTAPALASVACVLLGIGWGAVHAHRVGSAALRTLAGASVSLDGSLRTDPSRGSVGWHAVMDVSRVRTPTTSLVVHEPAWISGDEAPPLLARGDRLRVEGTLDVPDTADGFGSFLERSGIVAELEVRTIERLGPSSIAFVRWAQVFRGAMTDAFARLLPEREAGLMLGLALGDDTRLDPATERDFRSSGLSHLLVVSGGNVAMVLGPVLALGSLLRLSRWWRFVLGVSAVAFFVVLTGAEPSVLRAGVMAAIALIGIVLARPRSTGTVLSAAVLLLLVLDPTLVWSVGFQLSVLATAGMIALAGPLAERLRFLPEPLALATAATLSAQVAVTPLLLFWFHEVPTSTLVANVLAFPAVAPAMLLGLAAACASFLWAPLAALLARLALLPIRYLEVVADRAARAPVPWITGGGRTTLLIGLGVAAALAWWLRSGRRVPRTLVVAAVAVAPLVVWTSAISSGPPASLTVRFFDVGQGDAALITSPGGATILVDGGPDEAQVATELAAVGVKRLDLVVASHPHADHIVGLPAVLTRFPVGLLLEPGCETDSPDAVALEAAIASEDVPVAYPRAGQALDVGDVHLEILSPDRCWTGTESDTNNDAIVFRASIGEDSFLFATEPEEPAQQVLLDEAVDLTADVLKVPHHGAATSIRPFFDAVHPAVAIVSVGPNTYGHPVPEVLGWIRATGATVLRTDRAGTVTVSFEDHRVLVDSSA
jgi:DNA internalization-related competence protein ComEC/Rec2